MSAPNLNAQHDQLNEVQLIEVTGGWIVRVIENGRAANHSDFDRKRAAKSFAEAERKRLGIEKVTRI